ncbi:undecaprenyl-diphosphatase [Duganella sp. 3397]|uniref:phosphatase PAP2 family protein n=1 Tax=Duganella sp. 3397 TaxID=2817732 RepID=UPI00285EFEE5|nr:phosphatase PAP2 family protein [Duganella sp. 3397]MDR7051142.1 undecaprenyl-diphosphatase [Duganella sp. 3397]
MTGGWFDTLRQLNLAWFSLMNAEAGLDGWQLAGALFAAERVILLAPAALVVLWLSGRRGARHAAVEAALAVLCGLSISGAIGALWFHGRPFAVGIGECFLDHAPTSSFPSNHGTIMLVSALMLATSAAPLARRWGLVLLPLAVLVAWSRVFVGVHWPLDMLGAAVLALALVAVFRLHRLGAMSAVVTGWGVAAYRRLLAPLIDRGWLRP